VEQRRIRWGKSILHGKKEETRVITAEDPNITRKGKLRVCAPEDHIVKRKGIRMGSVCLPL